MLRSGRQIGLIAIKCHRYTTDTEIKLVDEGSLQKIVDGYTFLGRGKLETDNRNDRVGFVIQNCSTEEHLYSTTGINEHIMKFRFPLSKYITIVSAYTSTLTSPDEDKEAFYEDLIRLFKQLLPMTNVSF